MRCKRVDMRNRKIQKCVSLSLWSSAALSFFDAVQQTQPRVNHARDVALLKAEK